MKKNVSLSDLMETPDPAVGFTISRNRRFDHCKSRFSFEKSVTVAMEAESKWDACAYEPGLFYYIKRTPFVKRLNCSFKWGFLFPNH